MFRNTQTRAPTTPRNVTETTATTMIKVVEKEYPELLQTASESAAHGTRYSEQTVHAKQNPLSDKYLPLEQPMERPVTPPADEMLIPSVFPMEDATELEKLDEDNLALMIEGSMADKALKSAVTVVCEESRL